MPAIPAAAWIVAFLSWLGLTYAFLGGVIVGEHKPRLDQGLDGSWLLLTVSTESLAVLGTHAADAFPRPDVVVFASLVLFLAGAMLYILVIGLIFFRWVFRPMPAHTLTPTYWINMGAVAITTLAGARLIESAPAYAFVAAIEHFIAGFTLFFWATGTWWIPLLVALFAWRHARARAPIHYDAQYWSLVSRSARTASRRTRTPKATASRSSCRSRASPARWPCWHGSSLRSGCCAESCAVRPRRRCPADFANFANDGASNPKDDLFGRSLRMATDVVVRGNTGSIEWGPAIGASVIAGVVFAVIEVTLAWAVKGQSPWVPLHMIGAIGLGPSALTPSDTFDLQVIGVAVLIHFALAIVYGVILAFIVQRLGTTSAVIVGGIYGLALYLINFYGFTRWFPWFADARDWVSILSHVVQSGLMAGLYKVMAHGSAAAPPVSGVRDLRDLRHAHH